MGFLEKKRQYLLKPTLTILVLFIILLIVETLYVPASFSIQHKIQNVHHSTYENINHILSSYQVDSHLEVVLVGNSFNHGVVKSLNTLLDLLSNMYSYSTPLRFVHEKKIFHVSLGNSINDNVKQIISASANPSYQLIEGVLSRHHSLAATSTTLYILHSNSKEANATYSYSSKYSFCPQRAFISSNSEGFAWIDISAIAAETRPIENGRNLLHSLAQFKEIREDNLYELAALTYRSGEALTPFPYNPLGHSFRDYRDIHILIVTLCVDILTPMASKICKSDEKTLSATIRLINTYKGTAVSIGYTTIDLSLSEHPQLAHILRSSLKYQPASVMEKYATISVDDFSFWLASSSLIKDAIAEFSGPGQYPSDKSFLVPIFVLSFPDDIEATIFFEGFTQTLQTLFPFPSTGWGTSKLQGGKYVTDESAYEISSQLTWPERAIFAIRSRKPSVEDYVSIGVECSGKKIPFNTYHDDESMWYQMRELIWGITPSHIHYSSSSKGLVHDYLWHTPSVSTSSHGTSFTEKRAVLRSIVINKFEDILKKYSWVLENAHSMIPPINVTTFLEIGLTANGRETNKDGISLSQKLLDQRKDASFSTAKKSGFNSNKNVKAIKKGNLEKFLKCMDDAATDFSHLEYDLALQNMKNADATLSVLIQRLKNAAISRRGDIVCNDEPPVTKHFNNIDAQSNGDQQTATTVGSTSLKYKIFYGVLGGIGIAFIQLFLRSRSSRGGRW